MEIHPSVLKYHATKIDDYASCARRQFYGTVLGWKGEETANHKHFGSSWHCAMEQLLIHGYSPQGLVSAIEAFLEKYREKFDPTTDEIYYPKNPARATEALTKYVLEYMKRDVKCETLHTETYGAVPLNSEGRLIHFKMDSVLRDERGVFVREHKTGSRLGRQWTDKWQLDFQVGTYNHVGYCMYGIDGFWGVEINGTIFQKTQVQFARVPCSASFEMLNAWLTNINRWIDSYEEDLDILMNEDSESKSTMRAFKMDPTRCTDYFGCEYHAFCMSWANPLQHVDVIPIGFYQEFWDPSEEERTEEIGTLEVAL